MINPSEEKANHQGKRMAGKVLRLLSILGLLPAMVLSYWLWPTFTRVLGAALSPAMVLVLVTMMVNRYRKARKEGKISRKQLARAISAEVGRLLLTMGLTILAGTWAGREVGRAVLDAGSPPWLGVVAGMFAGFLVGISVGWMVLQIWKKASGTTLKRSSPSGREA
jgi:hypothetical protein